MANVYAYRLWDSNPPYRFRKKRGVLVEIWLDGKWRKTTFNDLPQLKAEAVRLGVVLRPIGPSGVVKKHKRSKRI